MPSKHLSYGEKIYKLSKEVIDLLQATKVKLSDEIKIVNKKFKKLEEMQKLIREVEKVKQERIREIEKQKSEFVKQIIILEAEIPILLDRLCVLVNKDKKTCLELLNQVLEEEPNLGKYYKKQQVFIPGPDISRDIDNLLKQFENVEKKH